MPIAFSRPARIPAAAIAALCGLLLACALGGSFAAVARADAAQVTVVSPGGAQQTLALDALAGSEDVVAHKYVLRSSSGESSQTVTGFSLAAVVEAAGADPFGFSYLEVQRPAGGAVQLSRHQALDPGAFPEGPPVVYATAAGTGFLRPGSDTGDLNASDSFEAPQGLTIVLRKGSGLRVRAEASPRRTRPGKTVRFSAVIDRAGSGEELTYSWYFGDGQSGEGATVSHEFTKPGSYKVLVGVTTPGDDVGASDFVRVQVGPPVEGGPDRQGGGHNQSKDAPDQGAAGGPSTGVPAGIAGTTGIAPTPVPTPEPIPAEPAPQATPTPGPAAQTPAPAGEQVSGLLLSSAGESAPSPEPEQQAAARTGSLDGDGGSGGGLPDAAWGLLAAAGLLGTGALIEVGGLSGLLARRRWMAP
jgi:hypothetical protein